tara:strand:+ start:365 stop:700 length:336 start_codon:yes stop_codon:yes gene_type:complete
MAAFPGDVEIVHGPRNNKVYLRVLDSGTPYSAKTAEDCGHRMLDIADEQAAQVNVYAPSSKLGNDFTPEQLREYMKSSGANFAILKGRFGPYMAALESNEDFASKAKVTVY